MRWSSSPGVNICIKSLSGHLRDVYFSPSPRPINYCWLSIFLVRISSFFGPTLHAYSWIYSLNLTYLFYKSMFPYIFFTLWANELFYDSSLNKRSWILGMWYDWRKIPLLSYPKSEIKRNVLSFFGMRNVGATHWNRLNLFMTVRASSQSSSCLNVS